MKKGSAELLILSLVEARARHGYEIGKLIEQRSEGAVTFSAAALYPLLYRLEKRGWIAGRWIEKEGQRRRRYYKLTPDGRRVRVAVRDAGPGIDTDKLDLVFTRFEQLDGSATRREGGMGLGLAFVRRLAQDTGLPLTVTSALGKGAEFALDLPLADAQAPPPPPPRRPTKARLNR